MEWKPGAAFTAAPIVRTRKESQQSMIGRRLKSQNHVDARRSGNGQEIGTFRGLKPNGQVPTLNKSRPRLQFRWASAISGDEWKIYREAIEAVRKARVPFLLGGGFALAAFTGRWRDTKDIDFYIAPKDRDRAVAALAKAGFADLYHRRTYDRRWIYRSIKADVIVDIIWSMANRRARVDNAWFKRAGSVSIRGQKIAVVPMEEFVWCKLYIVQRDHCDWTDVLNLIYARGQFLDWDHLINRLGEDLSLLKAILLVYGWVTPKQANKLPQSLWSELKLPKPDAKVEPGFDRIKLLDSRAWFAALQPKSKKLEV
jgi:hypothetical protein